MLGLKLTEFTQQHFNHCTLTLKPENKTPFWLFVTGYQRRCLKPNKEKKDPTTQISNIWCDKSTQNEWTREA